MYTHRENELIAMRRHEQDLVNYSILLARSPCRSWEAPVRARAQINYAINYNVWCIIFGITFIGLYNGD